MGLIHTPVTRCHQCGTSKGEEDVGVWVAFRTFGSKTEHMVWFQSEECKQIWLSDYADKIEIIEK